MCIVKLRAAWGSVSWGLTVLSFFNTLSSITLNGLLWNWELIKQIFKAVLKACIINPLDQNPRLNKQKEFGFSNWLYLQLLYMACFGRSWELIKQISKAALKACVITAFTVANAHTVQQATDCGPLPLPLRPFILGCYHVKTNHKKLLKTQYVVY